MSADLVPDLVPDPEPYCGHCGGGVADQEHGRCLRHLALEPPRFCTTCRRRMKVQVMPRGWSATCARHGVVAG
ncbi:MAG TPA: hypothetical protein VGE77_03660 [Nocardioides sp.]